ncbi:hypothetical protein LWI29_017138 [Acer saccharum]|uniref:Uncharacterized protein n=1 Tax=Acer saccharum TaxID=4024 RepID=A0AA39VG71_ACESA|nr:hypothetical protein LWI29_017138 [Acer saccharum]
MNSSNENCDRPSRGPTYHAGLALCTADFAVKQSCADAHLKLSKRNGNAKWKAAKAGDVVGKAAVPRKLAWKNSTPRVYPRRVKANCGS